MFTVKTILQKTSLSPLQRRMAFTALGHTSVPENDATLTADDCLRFWVIMLLSRLEFLATEQRTVIFDTV